MSWLAKINLNTVINRLGTFRSALLLLVLIIICLFCGYRMGNFFHNYQQQTLQQQQQRLSRIYQKQSEQVRTINRLEVELEMERLANTNSQALLKEMEQTHYQVKKQLAFYEKVMAPEKQADGVVIDNFTVTPTESNNHYRFHLALVQQKVKKRFAKGHVQLKFLGSFADKPKELALSKVSPITKQELSFSFKYFQIIEGEFTFPKGFTPEKIELATVLPKNKWQKSSRIDENYLWQNVIENSTQVSALILD